MSKRTIGIILVVLGLALAVLSLVADQLGVGGTPGIGLRQIAGAIVGVVIVASGIWWGWYRSVQKK